MAKKGDHGLDDSGLDNFDFDFDDPFEPKENKDRKPITRFGGGFADAVKNNAKSPSFYAGIMRNALPKEYREDLDGLDSVIGAGSRLYNKTKDDLKPSMLEVKRMARESIPRDAKYLPKKVRDWLHEPTYDTARMSEEQQRDMQVDLELNDMFKTNLAENAKFQEETRRRESIKQLVANKQHYRQIGTLEAIRKSMSRLVGYQDHVTARYQKKSLEIAYRHLFVAKDTLTQIRASAAEQNALLKDILKNTGLPDAVKLHNKDVVLNGVRERFMKKWEDKAVRGLGGLTKRLEENFGKFLQGQVEGIRSAVDFAGMAQSMGGQMDGAQTAGGFAGDIGSNWLGNKVGGWAAKKYGGNKVRAGAAKLGLFNKNAAGMAYDWADGVNSKKKKGKVDRYGNEIKRGAGLGDMLSKDEDSGNYGFQDVGGVKGWAKGFLAEMLGGRGQENKVATNFNEFSEDPVALNALTRRSIVEIIPGYLGRILREVTVANTGDHKTERLEYNLNKNTFTTLSGKRADMLSRIAAVGGARDSGIDLSYALKSIDPNGSLSEDAQKHLKKQLARNAANGKTFDVDALADTSNYHDSVPKHIKSELSRHFESSYKTNQSFKFGEAPGLDERKNQAAGEYYKLHERLPTLIGEIEKQIANGNTADLEALGLVTVNGDGTFLNFDAIYDMLLVESPLNKKAEFKYKENKRKIDAFHDLKGKPDKFHQYRSTAADMVGSVKEKGNELFGTLLNRVSSGFGINIDWRDVISKGKGAVDKYKAQADAGAGVLKDKATATMGTLKEKASSLSMSEIKDTAEATVGKTKSEVQAVINDVRSEYGQTVSDKLENAINKANSIKGAAAAYRDSGVARATSAFQTATTATAGPAGGNGRLGEEDWRTDVLAVLKESLEAHANSREILANINEQLIRGINTGGEGTGRRYGLRYGIRSFIGKFMSATGTVVKGAGAVYGKLLQGTAGMLGAGFKIATGTMGAVARKIGMIGRQGDIYVRGKKMPVLLGTGIKEGRYIDFNTKKVIKDLKHITGPVIDAKDDGNMVLTEEDFKAGLYDIRGTPVLRQITSAIIGMYSMSMSPVALALKLTTTGMTAVAKALMAPKDVYVVGEMNAPRLLARIMKSGGYYSQRTGRPIKHWKDIDGPVDYIDEGGVRTVVLTAEDIHQKGLVDRNGKQLKTVADKLAGAIKWGAGKVIGMGKAIVGLGAAVITKSYKLTKYLVTGLGKFAARGVGMNIKPKTPEEADSINTFRTVDLLQKIYAVLDKRLPGGKRRLGDSDGDGDRDGSWQDKMANAKQAAADKLKGGAGSKEGGLLAGLKGMFGKKKEGDEDDGDTTIIGGIPGLGKLWGKTKRGVGKLARGAGSLLKKIPGAKALGGFAGRMAGRAGVMLGLEALAGGGLLAGAGSALAGGAGALLTGVAAVFASPVVLGALAVAAVGAGAYFLYKAMKDKVLRNIRLLQYGVKPEESDRAKRVLALEDFLTPSVRFAGNTGSIMLDKRALKGALDAFGVDLKDDEMVQIFLAWFDARFKPVFLKNLAAARSIDPNVSLKDVDGDLKEPQKLEFLNKIEFSDLIGGPYEAYANPFDKGQITVEPSDIKAAFAKAREEFKTEKLKDPVTGKVTTSGAKVGDQALMAGKTKLAGTPGFPSGSNATRKTEDAKLPTSGLLAVTGGLSDSFARKSSLNALDIIRFKAYGLVELDIDKVRTLQDLEKDVIAKLTFSGTGDATFAKSADEYFLNFGPAFGVASENKEARENWMTWFSNRFIPLIVAYASAVRKLSTTVSIENASQYLKPDLQIQVVSALLGAKTPGRFFASSVWKSVESPWIGYVLNVNSDSVQGNVESLKKTAKVTTYTDPGAAKTPTLLNTPAKAPDAPAASTPAGSASNNPAGTPTPAGLPPAATPATLPSTKSPVAAANIEVARAAKPQPQTYEGSQPSSGSVLANGMIMPTKGRISSPYGFRIHPVTGARKMHTGIDIAAPRGTPVYAAADGIITHREAMQGYGNVIYIKHANGTVTRYGHMNMFQPGLAVGSEVKQGSIIGYVGSTGQSTGNHLHFEIRENDSATASTIDPLKAMGNDTQVAKAKEQLKSDTTAAKVDSKVEDPDTLEGSDTIASTVNKKPTAGAVAATETKTPAPKVGTVASVAAKAPASGFQAVSTPAPSASLNNVAKGLDDSVLSSQADRAKGNASTELRNQQNSQELSSGVAGMTQLLKEQVALQRKMAGHLENIESGIAEIAKAPKGPIQPASTAQATNDTSSKAAPKANNTPVTLAPISLKKIG